MREEELVLKARKGDAQAFGQLYDIYVRPIYRFVLVKVGHKADAEDLTHQVFLKAWKNVSGYKEKGYPFSSWLYRIARNTVVDHYRTAKKNVDIDSLPEEHFSESPRFDEGIDGLARVRLVRQAISELDSDYQSVILMKFVNELSNKEVANVLDKSEGAVRVIQHRALKQLKKIIDGKERDNPTTKEA